MKLEIERDPSLIITLNNSDGNPYRIDGTPSLNFSVYPQVRCYCNKWKCPGCDIKFYKGQKIYWFGQTYNFINPKSYEFKPYCSIKCYVVDSL